MDEALKKLLAELATPPKSERRNRKNHSIYLDTDLFDRFRRRCREQGHPSASVVLERFIAAYLQATAEAPAEATTPEK